MQRTQHPRNGFRRNISMALVGCVLVMGTATSAVAQCAYPALELLDFDYINSPQMTQNRGDEHMERHVCITAPNRQDNDRVERFAGIKYEFEGRLLDYRHATPLARPRQCGRGMDPPALTLPFQVTPSSPFLRSQCPPSPKSLDQRSASAEFLSLHLRPRFDERPFRPGDHHFGRLSGQGFHFKGDDRPSPLPEIADVE